MNWKFTKLKVIVSLAIGILMFFVGRSVFAACMLIYPGYCDTNNLAGIITSLTTMIITYILLSLVQKE